MSGSMEPLQTKRVKCSFGLLQVSGHYFVARHHLECLCRAAEKYSNVFPNLSSSVSERMKALTVLLLL